MAETTELYKPKVLVVNHWLKWCKSFLEIAQGRVLTCFSDLTSKAKNHQVLLGNVTCFNISCIRCTGIDKPPVQDF
jgi:hypothetical protein